jgi:hypothetical protein
MSDTVTIAGYGSLTTLASAQATNPSLSNFRWGLVEGFVRVFDLVSIINIRRERANVLTGEVATCTAHEREGHKLLVTLYEIPRAQLQPLLDREARLQPEKVVYNDEEGTSGEAILFVGWSSAGYRDSITSARYEEEVGQYYTGEVYRDDILPVRPYLEQAISAYREKGPEYLNNFLHSSFLGDGRAVSEYVQTSGL